MDRSLTNNTETKTRTKTKIKTNTFDALPGKLTFEIGGIGGEAVIKKNFWFTYIHTCYRPFSLAYFPDKIFLHFTEDCVAP